MVKEFAALVFFVFAQVTCAFAVDCNMSKEFEGTGSVAVWQSRTGIPSFYFRTNSDVNTDGSGRSYHPDDIAGNKGLAQNLICNGVNRKSGNTSGSCVDKPGDCQKCLDLFRSKPKKEMIENFGKYFESFAIAKDGASACIVPQGKDNAGYFVSTTSYQKSGTDICDPAQYLDAMVFPSIAVPKKLLRLGVTMGDYVLVRNRKNGRSSFGIVYDSSGGRIGESSIAMNRRLLCQKNKPGCVPPPVPTTVKQSYGLVVEDVDYLIFSGSAGSWPTSVSSIESSANSMFLAWGGEERIKTCADAYDTP